MSSTLDTVSQGGLTVFSIAAILLVAKKTWAYGRDDKKEPAK
jgi:hypothetical protein